MADGHGRLGAGAAGIAAGFAFGYLLWGRAKPAVPLIAAEQQALTAQGVVFAAPGAPDPPGTATMVKSAGKLVAGTSVDRALQILGPNRMEPLLEIGWRFWRPNG